MISADRKTSMEAFGPFFIFFGIGAILGIAFVALVTARFLVALFCKVILLPALEGLRAVLVALQERREKQNGGS